MADIYLITVTGLDAPGLTAELTGIISHNGARILDIGQSTIHNHLQLGFMLQLKGALGDLQQQLAPIMAAQQLVIDYQSVTAEDYHAWVGGQGQDRHSISILATELKAAHIQAVSQVIAEQHLNIFTMNRLSGRVDVHASNERPRSCIEFLVRGTPKDSQALRQRIFELSNSLNIDIAIQADGIYRRNRRLVCFDMDSTLIQTEVIDELAREAGVGDQVSQITEAAMAGELDFTQSFTRRMALLEGLDESVLKGICERLPITDGAERLCAVLRRMGYKLAILSGGFTYFGRYLQKRLGMDYVFANELDIVDGKVTGKVISPVIDAAAKEHHLRQLAHDLGIELAQTIAVGDGANDLPMLTTAGLGVAFHAKPLVREQSDHAINSLGLDAILYMIGLRDWQVEELDSAS